jgi:photosystem II stability/assembly factor-like uncharacterized protein
MLRPTALFRAAAALLPLLLLGASDAAAQSVSEADLQTVRPREIGPAVTSGRVTDLAVQADDPSIVFVATASGGLWKSTNAGHTWRQVFTGGTATFGDVAIAPSDPSRVYAGTGEQNNRQSTSWGDGVYVSDDGGETWRHAGLTETRHVGKIEVHPTNPDIAWVAGMGNLWAEGEERGVFRTTDGGRTWEKVLYVDEYTGAVDLVVSPLNPDELYAATYQRMRKAWAFNGGGPGGGIWKSTDGGSTWTRLSGGLPEVEMGRIGLAIAESSPNVVMALVEAPNPPSDEPGAGGGRGQRPESASGTYRSEDAGETWEKVSDRNGRPMYYSEIFIHPRNPNLVITAETSSAKSVDGGRTWIDISAEPTYDVGVHLDMHAVWMDPEDEEHFYIAGDAGLHETFDGGVNYRKINNYAIGQFYAIGVDMRDPYYVYGGMQDNHSWMGPSETRLYDGILNDDWKQIGFSDGMYQQVDLAGPRFVYSSATSGSYTRVDVIAGTKRSIRPVEPEGADYRFDWTSPGLASMHQEGLFYMAGNHLHISRDFGESYTATEDLSRGIDVSTRDLMGVPVGDIYISRNDGVGSFGVAATVTESPIDMNVLWVGMDDGNLQVTRDQGATWSEVSGNVPGLPDGSYVSRVEASAHDLATAYATFDRHRDGDFAPYIYRTTDFGQSWEPLHAGLPEASVNVIVEHPMNPDVLFVGTESNAWVSTTGGRGWTKIPGTPTTAYDDMVIHPRELDLVMGTHGRSVWILDDTRFLAEWTQEAQDAPAHLFSMDDGTLFRYRKDNSYRAQAEFAGENPPDGVEVTYRLGAGSGPAELRVTRSDGTLVRRMTVPAAPGTHRVNWDLRHGGLDEPTEWERAGSEGFPANRPPRAGGGPHVSPGSYTLTLVARGVESSKSMRVAGDPLLDLRDADYRATEAFLLKADVLGDRAGDAADDESLTETQRDALREIGGRIRRLAGGYGDAGRFYDGNFGPPSADEIAELDRLEVELAGLLGG